MYQKVLFSTDFSPYSQKITEYIGEIPGIREVVLLHVADTAGSKKTGEGPGAGIEQVKSLMAQTEIIIRHLGLKVQSNVDILQHTIHHGTIGSRILKTAEREKVSLIVMGAKGKRPNDLLLGSVSTYVLYHSTIPLLIVKYQKTKSQAVPENEPSKRPLFSKVLIPTDFSAPAGELLQFVKEIKGIDEIVLLHVIDTEKTDPRLAEYTGEAAAKIGAVRDELTRSGFSVKDHISVGYPPEEINLLARQEEATLIAISPLGEGWLRGLKELVIGSTTYAVVRRADRPVLVVRPINRA